MPLATPTDACREFATNCEAPSNVAWICTPFDTWERNPRYRGPAVCSPDFNDEEGNPTPEYVFSPRTTPLVIADEDIPF